MTITTDGASVVSTVTKAIEDTVPGTGVAEATATPASDEYLGLKERAKLPDDKAKAHGDAPKGGWFRERDGKGPTKGKEVDARNRAW